MAVTGAIFNSLIYGGIDSADYGIYITGEAVYNAPERAVDLVSVPGRNGALAIDQGRFENIEIEYPAGCFADDQTAFATAISDFRNAIMSQLGYQRLTDTYHPDEYRMALYISGIEVSPVRRDNGYAGEFTIRFNALPQRWLTSGEDPVSVTSGDELTNPTLFEASPLLMVDGYGNIDISGQAIGVLDATLDEQILHNRYTSIGSFINTITIDLNENLNALSIGDAFYIDGVEVTEITSFSHVQPLYPNLGWLVIKEPLPHNPEWLVQTEGIKLSSNSYRLSWKYLRLDFVYGTALTTPTYTGEVEYLFKDNVGNEIMEYRQYAFYAQYDGDKRITFYIDGSATLNIQTGVFDLQGTIQRTVTVPNVIGIPSLSMLTKYIDLEIGECYAYQGGELITWNNAAILPSDLPTLASGTNEITCDNTITDLSIIPRWWKL